jgi:hypothetical protein
MRAKTINFAGYKLKLDKDQVFPNDPGQGTPAMITSPSGKTATYNCVMDQGTVDDEDVPERIYRHFELMEDEINEFLFSE